MFEHKCKKRVRYADTDKMGYLYYGNYPVLYEIGRTEAIRSLGLSYQELEDEYHVMMPVIHVESRYIKPLYYDEEAIIHTMIKELPTKLIKFDHDIYNAKGDKVHVGSVKLFFVDMKTNKRVSMPSILFDQLKKYF